MGTVLACHGLAQAHADTWHHLAPFTYHVGAVAAAGAVEGGKETGAELYGAYGLARNLSVTAALPGEIERGEIGIKSPTFGVIVRPLNRVWRSNRVQAGGVVRVTTPGDRGWALQTGVAATREDRHAYGILGAVGRWATEKAGVTSGDRYAVDGQVGWRLPIGGEREFILNLESDLEFVAADRAAAGNVPDTGGRSAWLGPGLQFRLGDLFLEGAVRHPIWERLTGSQPAGGWEWQLMLFGLLR